MQELRQQLEKERSARIILEEQVRQGRRADQGRRERGGGQSRGEGRSGAGRRIRCERGGGIRGGGKSKGGGVREMSSGPNTTGRSWRKKDD